MVMEHGVISCSMYMYTACGQMAGLAMAFHAHVHVLSACAQEVLMQF